MREGIADFALILALIGLLFFGLYSSVHGESKKTKYRAPTVNEMISQLRISTMNSLADAMIDASNLGKIEQAVMLSCAKVWVSSGTNEFGQVYHSLEMSMTKCVEVK